MDITNIVFSVFKSVFIVYCFGAAGALFAKYGIIDKGANKSLSLISLYYFLPCLFFINTMKVITQDRVQELWFIILMPVIHIGIYYIIGKLGASLFFRSYTREFRFLLAASVAYSNCGDLVVSVLSTLGQTDLLANEDNPDFGNETGDERISRGIGYISCYVLMWTMSAWTWLWAEMDEMHLAKVAAESDTGSACPYGLMVPTSSVAVVDTSRDESDEEHAPTANMAEVPLETLRSRDGRDADTSQQPAALVGSAESTLNGTPPRSGSLSENGAPTGAPAVAVAPQGWSDRLKESALKLLKTPPFTSTVLGIIFGLIPTLRALFYNADEDSDNTPKLEFLTTSLILVGNAAIPLNMLVLGANLASGMGPKRQKVDTKKSDDRESNVNIDVRMSPDEVKEDHEKREKEAMVMGPSGAALAVVSNRPQPSSTATVDNQRTSARVSDNWVALFLCAIRLIIAPTIGIVIGELFARIGMLDDNDYLLKFTVMAVTMGPTGTTIVIMSQLKDLYVEDISMLVFQQYIVGLLTIPMAVIVMVIFATNQV